ncbi:ribose-5-phosphate isomerase RpiA [Piscibacillus halophilus]|uniref:Ribose-5-phosphate isomerase A n=1 Tax=Piscibacillus halophilus TaxID=571933 RepID=A0A1H9LSD8_9BACI|nr:ribose-5-phosphate isomerase RpiA [Piscibacillus halophilus]SER14310.1 ribose-5-phosphate isomerase [Piscibacillus halophilus]
MEHVDRQKQMVGEKAVDYIENGMLVGLGSGSTMYYMLKELGKRVKEGLHIRGVPSSIRTENWAKEFGIPLTDFSEVERLDIAIDGADEIDPNFNLIKGGGGSLLREKIVDAAADRFIVVADESKLVNHLGAFPLPVEVVRFGWQLTKKQIEELGCSAVLREIDDEVFVTNNNNYILDCRFDVIKDSEKLHSQLKSLLGVVETGLFFNMADEVIIGRNDGAEVLKREK